MEHWCKKCEKVTELDGDCEDGVVHNITDCCSGTDFSEIVGDCDTCDGTGAVKGCCYGMPLSRVECGCHGGMVDCEDCDGTGKELES